MHKESKVKDKFIFIAIALIIVLGAACYVNSLKGEFLWDDLHLIKENIYIKNWSNILSIFTENTRSVGGGESYYHRPVQMFTYMADYSLWKSDVRGYHLTNVVLHILAALGIYWLVNILYKDRLLSLLAGILFVVHPIHTEAVAYISGRADSLAAIFTLLCLILYIKHLDSKRISTYVLMLLSYILALLSKETSLILPLLLLLSHYTFSLKGGAASSGKNGINLKQLLPVLGITFIYIFLRSTVLKSLLPDISTGTTLFQRLPGFFAAVTDYTRLLFWPSSLHMEYGNKLFSIADPKVISGLLILFLSLFYAFKKRRSEDPVFFSICWFFIALIPVSNLYPVDAYMAEHWLYLPSIGFFLILANSLLHIYGARRFRIPAIILIISLLSSYSYLTIRQNNYWRDPVAFYTRTLKYAPNSCKMYYNLAMVYTSMGRNQEAIKMLKKTIELNPNSAEIYYSLGYVYCNVNNNEAAMTQFKKAIEIDPRHANSYNAYGALCLSINAVDEAIAMFKKALEIDANHGLAHKNLAKAYLYKKQNE